MTTPNSCGKVVYATRALAHAALRVLRKRTRDSLLAVYRCDSCQAFHLGHPARTRQRWKRGGEFGH